MVLALLVGLGGFPIAPSSVAAARSPRPAGLLDPEAFSGRFHRHDGDSAEINARRLNPAQARVRGASADEAELADLQSIALDPSQAPGSVLRSRPFLIGEESCPAFCVGDDPAEPFSEAGARARLVRFLERRGLPSATIEDALERYDDPTVGAIVPAPTLRAALLMLWAWDPYQVTIRAALDAENPTGMPYDAIVFGDIGYDDAVATLVGTADGTNAILVNEAFAAESPEQLASVLIHESMHDAVANSQQEEIAANILDTIAYAEFVLVDPSIAHQGTDLTRFNNGALLALLNSTGRAGPSHLGTEATPLGDVWLGNQLTSVDASSIRDAIAGDGFYATLPRTGSPGHPVLTALLSRMPDAGSLGPTPDYDETTLAAIDAGVGQILSPEDAVALAATLGLDIAGPVTEGVVAGPLATGTDDALAMRPFVPQEIASFAPGGAEFSTARLTEDEGRIALSSSFRRRDVPDGARTRILADYDDPAIRERIPDPALRVATLMLGAWSPWDVTRGVVLSGANPSGLPLAVRFASLPLDRPVAQVGAGADTGPAIVISDALRGEDPALLASYVVEGTLLRATDDETDENRPTTGNERLTAALLGTLAYADMVGLDPDLAAANTGGVLARNTDLLALLNSTAFFDEIPANADRLGFLAAPAGVSDILPGLYADAESFAAYVAAPDDDDSAGTTIDGGSADDQNILPSLSRYLTFAGVGDGSGNDPLSSDNYIAGLDAHMDRFLVPEEVLALARALRLGAAIPG